MISLDMWTSFFFKDQTKVKPTLEIVYVKNVKPESIAHKAGLKERDRIISINDTQLCNKDYTDIVKMIESRLALYYFLFRLTAPSYRIYRLREFPWWRTDDNYNFGFWTFSLRVFFDRNKLSFSYIEMQDVFQ